MPGWEAFDMSGSWTPAVVVASSVQVSTAVGNVIQISASTSEP